MNLLLPSSPLEDPWIALDLETTGLSRENDQIIEIGAVKFQGDRVLDTYRTFVNPNRRLDDFIRRYTGISQTDVDDAPIFASVAADLVAFVGSSLPCVPMNNSFAMKDLLLSMGWGED